MRLSTLTEGSQQLFKELEQFVEYFPPLNDIVQAAVQKIAAGKSVDFQLVDMFGKCWEFITTGNNRNAAKGRTHPGIQLLDSLIKVNTGLVPFYPMAYSDNPNAIEIAKAGSNKVSRILRPGLLNKQGFPRLKAIVELEDSRPMRG